MSHEKPDDLCDKLARAIFEFFESRQIRAPESRRRTYDELPDRYRRDYLRHANDAILPIVARTVAEGREARAEVARLRADAERFRWLAVQKRLHLYTDGGTWTRADGTTFRAWGVLAANGVGYPPAETLAEMVDTARKDQENGR